MPGQNPCLAVSAPRATSSRSLRIAASLLGAALLVGASSGYAHADGTDSVARNVRMGDLDLASAQGVTQAVSRLKAAAHQICDETVGNNGDLLSYTRCVDDATDNAMPQLSLHVADARIAAMSHGAKLASASP